jgi:hypothetical protein
MVMMIAAISPTQFSALKVLDRLHDQEEHGEDHDGQTDHQEVIHGSS